MEGKTNVFKSLEEIKSNHVLKDILSLLWLNRKLSLVNYNKKLQKKLQISIEDYKNVCERYKVIDKNGKGKEYKANPFKLIFEGEYKNGKRNGKGKEYYDNGNLKFEGEYFEGKIISGKGKEYDNDKLKFEGEYLNGQRNGKGKEYDKHGKLIFEGEYLNGQSMEWRNKRIFFFW